MGRKTNAKLKLVPPIGAAWPWPTTPKDDPASMLEATLERMRTRPGVTGVLVAVVQDNGEVTWEAVNMGVKDRVFLAGLINAQAFK